MVLENEQNIEEEPIEEPQEELQVEEAQEEETVETEESIPAEEALSEASEEEVDPKDAVIGDFRKQLRESNQMVKELSDKIEALKPKEPEPEPEVVKSPIELALEQAAEEQGVDIDDAEIVYTGKLVKEQQAFERSQREYQTKTMTQEQADRQANEAAIVAAQTMSEEAMGKGLDFKTMVEAGADLITKEAYAFLASESKDYADFYEKLYEFSKDRILKAGGENAKILQANIDAHSQVKKEPQKKPEKKVPTQKEIIEGATTVNEAHVNSLMNA